jgi:hypothetical protein
LMFADAMFDGVAEAGMGGRGPFAGNVAL